MERLKQRSSSVKRPTSKPREPNLDEILTLINPLNKEFIELEDMKRLLERISTNSRTIVQQIFHNYIFTTKSFALPVTEFCKLFTNSKSLTNAKNFEEIKFTPANKGEIKSPESTKMNSVFSEVPRGSQREYVKIISPERHQKSSTYAKIYEEKKSNVKKHILRRNTQPLRLIQAVDTSPSLKIQGTYPVPRNFKDCYPNIQELIDIRKAHLHQTHINT